MEPIEEEQEHKQRMIDRGSQSIVRALGITPVTGSVLDAIKGVAGSLYIDWGNAWEDEHLKRLTEQLSAKGIEVRIQHFTGDSSFPTEYTIRRGRIIGLGPTFDMALIDFISSAMMQQDIIQLWGGQM